MKDFGAYNYSYFFRDAVDGEEFSFYHGRSQIHSIDMIKGIALLHGFTVQELPNYTAKVKRVETVTVEVELNAYQGGVVA